MDSTKHNGHHSRGFTLVELLVVIAIIALLVSILLPALHKAQLQAKLVLGASQQRQILLALKQYGAENDGKEPPPPSFNDNGSNVWWDFPNYLASHGPAPVGGSVGWQFGQYLPTVDVWFCPLATMSPNTELQGNDGVFRTVQEIYLNPDPVNHTWVWMTFSLLWGYGACADTNLTANIPPFRGPGLEDIKGDNIRPGADSDLAIMDFLAFNNNAGRWWSGHPFEGSTEGSLFHLGPGGDPGVDISGEIGSIDYNAGYIDGRVERFKTEGTDPEGQYMGRNMTLYFPKDWW